MSPHEHMISSISYNFKFHVLPILLISAYLAQLLIIVRAPYFRTSPVNLIP